MTLGGGMIIRQKRILRSVFSLKGNFSPGLAAPKRVFDNVEIAPFWNACSAAVSVSADFELNWAFRGRSAEERDRLGATERQNVPYILSLLEELQIPITWATVGHLFLSSCSCNGRAPHDAMPRPPLNARWQGDWYKHDPCTDLQRDPLWYAPDLIEQVMNSRVGHEIGSHTFSHIDFSSKTSNRELVEREIEESIDLMAPLGLRLRSLVYPFNNMGHSYHELLYRMGVIAVRHRDSRVRLSYPERSIDGVYKIYESMNLRMADLYDYRDKAELFIGEAVERQSAYHLWFHPSDPRSVFEKEFYGIMSIIDQRRKAGSVWVATMGQLAAYCEARERTTLKSATDNNKTTIEVRSSLDTEKYGASEVTLIMPTKEVPKSIQEKANGVTREVSIDHACSIKSGRLVLNIPAKQQTLTLSF